MSWRDLAKNEVPAIDGLCAVIIGLSPSKGARSPLLWNAAFERLGIEGRMVPIDIDELAGLVAGLAADEQVIGGAVTMPHKATISHQLVSLSPLAQAAGAVNCLLRVTGGLAGENTDGIAALRSIERVFGSIRGARALVLGSGGAGSAVAGALAPALGREGSLVIANRDPVSLDSLVERLGPSSPTNVSGVRTWPIAGDTSLGAFDIVVNASSLGFHQPIPHRDGWLPARFASPIAGVDDYPVMRLDEAAEVTEEQLGDVLTHTIDTTFAWLGSQRDAMVFDVIYQPERTLLLELAERAGCRTVNGSWMNLEQAVIAFSASVAAATGHAVDRELVRDAMLVAVEEAA